MNEYKKCCYASVDSIVEGSILLMFVNRNCKNTLYIFFCLQVESILNICI